MQLLEMQGSAVLEALMVFVTNFVLSNLNRLPSLGSHPGLVFAQGDAAAC